MGAMFTLLMQFLVSLVQYFASFILDLFVSIINLFISGLFAVGSSVLSLFPSASLPTSTVSNIPPLFLSTLNWFLPISTIIACLGVYCIYLSAIFLIKPILKFIHVS